MSDADALPDAHRAALWAARRGWYVHPLRPDDKRPLWGDWEHRATLDPDVIRSWPRRTTGYGIACGPSRLYVVDCDVPKPSTPPPPAEGIRDGLDTLAWLAEQRGASIEWATFQVTTGRGGAHLYYQAPDGVELRNSASTLGWLLDGRGNGGYVVGPGSVVAGNRYATLHASPPAPLPGWILVALTSRSGGQAANQRGASGAHSGPPAGARPAPGGVAVVGQGWIEAALNGEAERVRTAPTGQGNETLASAAYRLGQLVGASLTTRETAEAVLTAALDTWTWDEPSDRTRMVHTLTSGLAAGERNPRVPAPREQRMRAA
jgi:hypothetical protein